MPITTIDERDLILDLKNAGQKKFLNYISQFEKNISPIMRSQGYKRINRSERTVLFTFGEITFSRDRWYKKGECVIPLDVHLGLEKNVRYSRELQYQIVKLATYLTYRQVVDVVRLMYGLIITKDTVLKAIDWAGKRLKDKVDYLFYEEIEQFESEKRTPKLLFIEGDGFLVKTTNKDNFRSELAHFIVHEGVQKIHNRNELINKKEFVSLKINEARENMISYIFQTYHLNQDTILVTTSDGGKGYSAYSFAEIANQLNIHHHEHFYDPYHLNRLITENTGVFPPELASDIFESIFKRNKSKLKTTLDTMESMIETEEELTKFLEFKKRLLSQYRYTRSAKQRGLGNISIGIMESQHRKMTYRMKHRGMYWSKKGAEVMSQLILLRQEGTLREVLCGDWHEDYIHYKQLEKYTVESFLDFSNDHIPHTIPIDSKVHLKSKYRKYQNRSSKT